MPAAEASEAAISADEDHRMPAAMQRGIRTSRMPGSGTLMVAVVYTIAMFAVDLAYLPSAGLRVTPTVAEWAGVIAVGYLNVAVAAMFAPGLSEVGGGYAGQVGRVAVAHGKAVQVATVFGREPVDERWAPERREAGALGGGGFGASAGAPARPGMGAGSTTTVPIGWIRASIAASSLVAP